MPIIAHCAVNGLKVSAKILSVNFALIDRIGQKRVGTLLTVNADYCEDRTAAEIWRFGVIVNGIGMKPLTKPMKGFQCKIGSLLVHINFAKTLVWAKDYQKEDYLERQTHFLLIQLLQRTNINAKALSIILGPFKILIGW